MFNLSRMFLLSFIGIFLISSAAQAQVMEQYKVRVKTGKGTWAATAANVWVTLYGNNPWIAAEPTTESLRTRLAIPDHRNFARGADDTYTVNSYDLENVYAVRIEHDNIGKHPAWYLENIQVTNPRGKTWTYTCNCWIDKKSGLSKVLYQDNFIPPGLANH